VPHYWSVKGILNYFYVKAEVMANVNAKVTVLWGVAPGSSVDVFLELHFKGKGKKIKFSLCSNN
jgi:hypothetical protein